METTAVRPEAPPAVGTDPKVPRIPRARRHVSDAAVAIGFATAVLTLWQLTQAVGWLPEYILGPLDVARGLIDRRDQILPEVMSSIRRVAVSFIAGSAAGAILGMAAGVLRPAQLILDPLVSWTYPLPKIAMFPVIGLWLGWGDSSRMALIAAVCFYPVFVHALSGATGIPTNLLWVARNVGAGAVRTFCQVIFPSALPRLLVGMRISLAASFVMLFATESMFGRTGLGFIIYKGYEGSDYPLMYGGLLALSLIGFLADRVVLSGGRRLTRGQLSNSLGGGR